MNLNSPIAIVHTIYPCVFIQTWSFESIKPLLTPIYPLQSSTLFNTRIHFSQRLFFDCNAEIHGPNNVDNRTVNDKNFIGCCKSRKSN